MRFEETACFLSLLSNCITERRTTMTALASKVQSLRIIKNKNKGKLKDNIELYINIVINHRRPIAFGSFCVDQ